MKTTTPKTSKLSEPSKRFREVSDYEVEQYLHKIRQRLEREDQFAASQALAVLNQLWGFSHCQTLADGRQVVTDLRSKLDGYCDN
jgi:hypothetical protein